MLKRPGQGNEELAQLWKNPENLVSLYFVKLLIFPGMDSAQSFLYPLNLISDESMQLLVQAILSVSGESKKPDLQDCLLLQNSPARNLSGSQSEPHTSYMVEYSQKYQTDESYRQAVPQIQKSKCCPG